MMTNPGCINLVWDIRWVPGNLVCWSKDRA